MSGEELKPCPFCGGAAEWLDLLDIAESDPNFGGSVIQCTKCNASSHVEFGYKENLASIWNARNDGLARAADLEAVLRKLRDAITSGTSYDENGEPIIYNGDIALLFDPKIDAVLEGTSAEPNAN